MTYWLARVHWLDGIKSRLALYSALETSSYRVFNESTVVTCGSYMAISALAVKPVYPIQAGPIVLAGPTFTFVDVCKKM